MVKINEDHMPALACGTCVIVVDLHHEVVGLDVPVENSLLVQVIHGLKDLPHQLSYGSRRHHTALELMQKAVEKRAALGLVHDDVVEALVLQHLGERHDACVWWKVQHPQLSGPVLLFVVLVAELLLGLDLHDVVKHALRTILWPAHHHLAAIAILLDHSLPIVEVVDLLIVPQLPYGLRRRFLLCRDLHRQHRLHCPPRAEDRQLAAPRRGCAPRAGPELAAPPRAGQPRAC
mmetsp:Transcript_85793/g.277889  ORF Transcript_85793/g.277889 Transcript_85793/m.277889 type:complete len:233 (+) Transcript_85793:503-1201(+)